MNYLQYFTKKETQWLMANPEIKEQFFEVIDDASNVNPLENGEPDLAPLNRAIEATKLTIAISGYKMIKGPYKHEHWLLIKKAFPKIKMNDKTFWHIFSFECAIKKEEFDEYSKEMIYLAALIEVVAAEQLEEIDINNYMMLDLNTGKLNKLRGTGVNAKI